MRWYIRMIALACKGVPLPVTAADWAAPIIAW
jgi:hypothetical protein